MPITKEQVIEYFNNIPTYRFQDEIDDVLGNFPTSPIIKDLENQIENLEDEVREKNNEIEDLEDTIGELESKLEAVKEIEDAIGNEICV